MYSASYGHAFRHALQPMQRSRSKSTIPSSRLVQRLDRADLHARRVGAVVAAQHREVAGACPGTRPARCTSPTCGTARPAPVLGLARHGARVAADARALVDGEAVAHASPLSSGRPPPRALHGSARVRPGVCHESRCPYRWTTDWCAWHPRRFPGQVKACTLWNVTNAATVMSRNVKARVSVPPARRSASRLPTTVASTAGRVNGPTTLQSTWTVAAREQRRRGVHRDDQQRCSDRRGHRHAQGDDQRGHDQEAPADAQQSG